MAVAKRAPAKKPAPKKAPPKKPAPAAPAVDPNIAIDAEIRKNFGYEAWMLNEPELRHILEQGTAEGWDAPKIQGALEQTTWWKQHSDSQRTWTELKANDPATAAAKLQAEQTAISQAAAAAGVNLDPARLSAMSESAVSDSWTGQQLQAAIAAEFHYDPGKLQGDAATTHAQFQQIANDYLMPLSDQTMGGYVQQALAGTLNQAGFAEQMKNQAKNLYGLDNPTIGHALDQGTTMRALADPYKQAAAKDLEIDPNTIDFSQPKWQKALMTFDPTTKAMRPMTTNEWQQTYRGDTSYGWQNTQNGRDAASSMAAGLVKAIQGNL